MIEKKKKEKIFNHSLLAPFIKPPTSPPTNGISASPLCSTEGVSLRRSLHDDEVSPVQCPEKAPVPRNDDRVYRKGLILLTSERASAVGFGTTARLAPRKNLPRIPA